MMVHVHAVRFARDGLDRRAPGEECARTERGKVTEKGAPRLDFRVSFNLVSGWRHFFSGRTIRNFYSG
jgi:hypothetical protein